MSWSSRCASWLLVLACFSANSYAGTLVFEAEEEEEIIISGEPSSPLTLDFDLAALGADSATAASLFIDLSDSDTDAENAQVQIGGYTGTWAASSGSPTPGFHTGSLDADILESINRDQSLQVQITATTGNFTYSGAVLTLTTDAVPEPSSLLLLAAGLPFMLRRERQ